PLPPERRVGLARHPGGARLDLPLRGPGHRVQAPRGPVLPLPVPAAAAARAGAELRRGRRPRDAARDHRLAAGDRGDQARARHRRQPDRPPAPLRCSRACLHRGQAPSRPRMPRLWRVADDHRVHRLRRVLPGTTGRGALMATVRIPPTLRTATGGAREVEASGGTVRDLLDDLTERYPTRRGQVFENGEIAPFVNVYVEGEDVRTLEGLETDVPESSTVILLPAMAGGQRVDLAPSLLDLVGHTPLVELQRL